MQLTLPSRVMVIALIIASRLTFASPVAHDLFDRQDTGTGGIECKH